MQIAALTHVYNEAVNLPIWIAYYSRNFGAEHLYVLDHGSTDGSTSNLGPVTVIRIPHTPFDDNRKSISISALHKTLIQHFDCVVVTDCDEIVLPDPERFPDLRNYIETVKPVVTAGIGLQLHHIIDRERPIDLSRPILSQRSYASFNVPTTKPLISSVATAWVAGAHACDAKPALDPALFNFHTKFMDYATATRRHALNAENTWSEAQISSGHGAHHRYGLERFVQEGFLSPWDVVNSGRVEPFQFDGEIAAMEAGVTHAGGVFAFGHAEPKCVKIPERFAEGF